MAHDKLAILEGELLSKEVAYIYKNSPFYRRRMRERNI